MPSLAHVCTQNATLQATSQGAIINVLAQQRIISTGGCEEVGIGIGWGVGSPFIEKNSIVVPYWLFLAREVCGCQASYIMFSSQAVVRRKSRFHLLFLLSLWEAGVSLIQIFVFVVNENSYRFIPDDGAASSVQCCQFIH